MKRLKNILLRMDPNTTTFTPMYSGNMMYIPTQQNTGKMDPQRFSEPTYWKNNVSYTFSHTHKYALDKPTITIQIPAEQLGIKSFTMHIADYCLRVFNPYINMLNKKLSNWTRPDIKSGKYYIYLPRGEILTRNCVYFSLCPQMNYVNGGGITVYQLDDDKIRQPRMCLCIRLQVQLPYKNIKKSIKMLCRDLPKAVDMFTGQFDLNTLNEMSELNEKQTAIRAWLKKSEYCAFIANGSILPRSKGTDFPMGNAVEFQSPTEDEIEVCGVKGMGIKRGVTVITGGGYSGKSTLLDAISAGIYDHILGDGRELCITDENAIKISAEDGRSVKNLNISPFIKWIPGGNTYNFSTDHASGSTSQAANIMEAVDFGAKLLLIDEDKSATNFMIRDKLMKELIEKEPITPFTERVNELYNTKGVSTILVIGGSGEYLSIANRIYMMKDFVIQDVTKQSKQICQKYSVTSIFPQPTEWVQKRILLHNGFTSYPKDSNTERLEISDMGFIFIGEERIDIRMLHNIITPAQLNAIGFMLRYLENTSKGKKIDIKKRIDELYLKIENEGLDCVYSSFFTTCERFLDLPRKFELLAVINRMRKINFITEDDYIK